MTDYEKYQLKWMIDHGYSLKDLMNELSSFQYEYPEDTERIATPIDQLFAEWEADVGFGSEIWACKEEWRDCEMVKPAKEKEAIGSGIIRRMDDLGRIVIPRDIRKTFNFKEDDAFEVFVSENAVTFRKYDETIPIRKALSDFKKAVIDSHISC